MTNYVICLIKQCLRHQHVLATLLPQHTKLIVSFCGLGKVTMHHQTVRDKAFIFIHLLLDVSILYHHYNLKTLTNPKTQSDWLSKKRKKWSTLWILSCDTDRK